MSGLRKRALATMMRSNGVARPGFTENAISDRRETVIGDRQPDRLAKVIQDSPGWRFNLADFKDVFELQHRHLRNEHIGFIN